MPVPLTTAGALHPAAAVHTEASVTVSAGRCADQARTADPSGRITTAGEVAVWPAGDTAAALDHPADGVRLRIPSRAPAGRSPLVWMSAPMFVRHENQMWVCARLEVRAVGGSAVSQPAGRSARPVLGLRRTPGRLAVAVFRLPLPLYRRGWGRLLGHTFLLLMHAGRKTGKLHSTVAMVLRYDRQTHEAVICSAWGQDTDWIRNIRVRPALQVQIGRESFTPQQRFLSEEESLAVVAGFRRAHPQRLRLFESILGWGDLRSDTAARDFVSTRPFVSFRPADPPTSRGRADGK